MKKLKKILSFCLIVCICFCTVGCNKVTDTNSSSLSSTITEIETIYLEEESSTNDTTTEESEVETTVSGTPSENTTPTQSTITSSTQTPSQESTPSSSEIPTTSKDPNAPLTDEELREFMPDWFFEYPAREIVDICEMGRDPKQYFVITAQNELYELSPDKLFSNGTHFKKVESDDKFVRFAVDTCGYGYNPFATAIAGGAGIMMLTTENWYYFYGIAGFPEDNGTSCGDHCALTNSFTVLSEKEIIDGREVAGTSTTRLKYQDNNVLSLDDKILYSFPQNETITSAVTHVVQTTKGYYYIHAKTEQEFADLEPVTTYSAEFIGTKPEDRFIKYFRENS